MAPTVAVRVVPPLATARARPAGFTVAAAVTVDDQLAASVTSALVLSVKIAVALYCWLSPTRRVVVPGSTMICAMVPESGGPAEVVNVTGFAGAGTMVVPAAGVCAMT